MSKEHSDHLVYKEVDFDPFGSNDVLMVPTTEAQREIWTNVQFGGHAANCAYNESVSLHIEGPFDVNALRNAVNLLFSRHSALRSTFSKDGMHFFIAPEVHIDVPLIDLSNEKSTAIDIRLQQLLDDEAEHDFDLANGPLGKITLVKVAAVRYQLILTFHHIVCDGWSLGILMQDLSKMYSALVSGKPYDAPPAISYADYSADEEKFLKSTASSEIEDYWVKQYRNQLPTFELPLNRKRPPLRTYNASRIDLEVNPQVISTLKKTGARHGVSFVATLVAAFEVFMFRITGSSDIVVGLAAAGQASDGNDSLVGHCVNLLPLRSNIDGTISFEEYLKIRKPLILDAYDHQRYTFGSLIRKLNIPRDPSRIPLVPVSFNVDLGITNGVHFEGCTYHFTTNPRHYENFEIFINAAGSGNEMTLECTYNTDLFSEEMMDLRIREFSKLLSSLSENPAQQLNSTDILLPEVKKQLFTDWVGEEIPLTEGQCLHHLFEMKAKELPSAIAIKCGNRQITYGELNSKADAIAAGIRKNNVSPGSFIALYMERSVELMAAILGVLKSGCAYVPIDMSYPADRISYLLSDSGANCIITSRNLKIDFANETQSLLFAEDYDGSNSINEVQVKVTPSDLAYMIYTSGSTGKPKGVAIEHRSAVNYITWCNQHYFANGKTGNFGLYSSLSFDLTVTSIFCSLSIGKTLTVFPQELDVVEIFRQTFNNNSVIDVIKLTPAHILLLENLQLSCNNIITAIVGGEELTSRHVSILRKVNPAIHIFNEYGPTEATVGCIVKEVVQDADITTIGRPIQNTRIYILDEHHNLLPPGIPGRLFIGGAGLARHYHNRTDLTTEKFIVLNTDEGFELLYDSGDLARFRTDGEIEFLGRIDNQVKIRGYRIELGEIESELIKHPDISEELVIAHTGNTGEKQLVAYVVLNKNAQSSSAQLASFLKMSLPDFMIPAHFIFLDKFPLTSNGKIDRKALLSPEGSSVSSSVKYEEPANPLEEMLANIWCQVLGLEKVGRKDDFFELGGHSIIGVRICNEIEKQLGVNIQLSAIFRAPNIEELSKLINKEESSRPWSCLVPLKSSGNKRPLFCIHMHNGNVHRWRVLVKHMADDQPVYAIQPRGLDDSQKPHTTIEEMAAYYIEVMKEVQPSGPYNLIGLCFSGMVVFEMAALLQQQGEKVEFLAMVNNYAPPENPTLYKVKTELNKFMKMELGDKFNYALEKNMNLGKKLLFKARKFMPAENAVTEMSIDEPSESIGNDLRTIHSLALLNYHPTHVYKGDLVIFRTADPIEEFYNEYLGWDRLISGKIETTVIAGCNNDTIITDEPYNAIMAVKIREYLERRKVESASGKQNPPGGMFSAAVL